MALGGLLGASWDALGAQKTLSGAALGRPKGAQETCFSDLGVQKAPKMEPRRVPKWAPKAIRAENGKTLIFDDSCKDFNDF